mgnify:CR=1 FL=1
MIYAVNNGFFDGTEMKDLADKEKNLLEFMRTAKSKLLDQIAGGEWNEKVENGLKEGSSALTKSAI